jgi:hypothetical protein
MAKLSDLSGQNATRELRLLRMFDESRQGFALQQDVFSQALCLLALDVASGNRQPDDVLVVREDCIALFMDERLMPGHLSTQEMLAEYRALSKPDFDTMFEELARHLNMGNGLGVFWLKVPDLESLTNAPLRVSLVGLADAAEALVTVRATGEQVGIDECYKPLERTPK